MFKVPNFQNFKLPRFLHFKVAKLQSSNVSSFQDSRISNSQDFKILRCHDFQTSIWDREINRRPPTGRQAQSSKKSSLTLTIFRDTIYMKISRAMYGYPWIIYGHRRSHNQTNTSQWPTSYSLCKNRWIQDTMLKHLAGIIAAWKRKNKSCTLESLGSFWCPWIRHIEFFVRFWFSAWLAKWLARELGLPVLLGWVVLLG